MLRQERIKLDRNSLAKEGYKKIKLINLFNYYNDHESCVTVYRAKLGKEKHFKYFFPLKLNPDELWDKVKKELTDEVLRVHYDFYEDGIIYNALMDKQTKKAILLIKFKPMNNDFEIKEVEYNG